MRKLTLFFFTAVIGIQVYAQNSIGIQLGFRGTYTRVAEYLLQNQSDYLLDSVSVNRNIGFFLLYFSLEK